MADFSKTLSSLYDLDNNRTRLSYDARDREDIAWFDVR